MSETVDRSQARPLLGLLLRVKLRGFWNRLRQAVDDAPVRLSAGVLLVVIVWLGLYGLFWAVFYQIRQTPLEATVAIPLVFNFFFVAMLVMLALSNAIIAYGSLFSRKEAAYLLASPLTPLDVVTLKYLESLALASWSLVLLGLPLMMAMADPGERPIFHVLFIAFFLAFIPIPAAIGVFFAWFAARFFSRRTARLAAVIGGAIACGFILWGMRSLNFGESAAEVWLRSFLERMSFIQSAFLPNHWVAAGIDHALHYKFGDAFLYFAVTLANAMFLSWLVVRFVARRFESAFDRASAGWGGGEREAADAAGGISNRVFFYLPRPLRLIAAKDLRTFLRDPLQWSQLVILFGLMILYLTNMPTLRLQFSGSQWFLIIPFLNLCAVSLILATFTCRFVFPLVSLEGQQLWFVGLLPLPRSYILLAKFAFAMTVTVAVALTAMLWATVMLDIAPAWAVIHIVITVAICFGLCAFAVGIGARLPMFHQTNTARIANGMGGTTNLLASVALVAVVLFGVGVATWRSGARQFGAGPDGESLLLCLGSALFAIGAGVAALRMGARHFQRAEI